MTPDQGPPETLEAARPARVVVLSHGHPDYSLGGAEMAAYSLFSALRLSAPEDTYLVSAISPQRARGFEGSRLIKIDDSDFEWAFITESAPWPNFEAPTIRPLQRDLIPLLQKIDPDVIHLHHFMGFGVDVIRLIRLALPRAVLVFTFHEYLAICSRDGQMLTTPSNSLCDKASPIRCTGCFPNLLRSQIWLREQWFKRHFAEVDLFTSPSHFLRKRYVDWGMPEDRIRAVENPQIASARPVELLARATPARPVFAFFGQINPYKGVDLLLDAVERVRQLTDKPFEVRLHGVIRDYTDFRAKIEAKVAELAPEVSYRGAYDADRVISLMQASDYVLVPSIWWENSPVVIEEAFHAGRPVICADIGGMREKVRDGVDGLHFRARDAESLAAVLLRCIDDPSLAGTLGGQTRKPPSLGESDRAYRALYAEAQSWRAGRAQAPSTSFGAGHASDLAAAASSRG